MTARYLMPSIRDCSKIVNRIALSEIDYSATDKHAQAFDSVVDRAEIDFGTVERLDRCTVRDKAVQIYFDLVRHEKARRN